METVALVELESTLTGDAPDTFTVVYPGGRVGNIGSSVSDTPNFRTLGRYILAIGMSWDVGERGEWSVGDRDLLRWKWLDANGTLPAPALLRAIWREHCAVDFNPEKEGRPTAPFVPLLPDWVLRTCEHY